VAVELLYFRQQACVWYGRRAVVYFPHRHFWIDGPAYGWAQERVDSSCLGTASQAQCPVSITDELVELIRALLDCVARYKFTYVCTHFFLPTWKSVHSPFSNYTPVLFDSWTKFGQKFRIWTNYNILDSIFIQSLAAVMHSDLKCMYLLEITANIKKNYCTIMQSPCSYGTIPKSPVEDILANTVHRSMLWQGGPSILQYTTQWLVLFLWFWQLRV